MENRREQDPKVSFLIKIAYWAVILAIVYLVLKYLLNMLMPFFLAFVFAAVVRPVSHLLSRETRYVRDKNGNKVLVKRRFRLNRTVAGVLSVLLLFTILGTAVVLIVVRTTDSAAELFAAIPGFYESSIVPGFNRIYNRLLELTARLDESLVEALTAAGPNLISNLGSTVTTFSARAVSWLTSLATRLPSLFLNTLICLIATVFIAVDFDRIKLFIRRNLPEKMLRMAVNVRNSFLEMIWQFLKSYFIIFLITMTENAIGLWIIGVHRPLLIGFIVAALDAFPVLGSGTVLVPWGIINLITGNVGRGLGILAVYVWITVVRQIIEPRIVGKRVGLRPVVTLICMYAGTRLFGGLGLFGLPIAAAIVADLNSNGIIHLFNRVPYSEEQVAIAEAEERGEEH